VLSAQERIEKQPRKKARLHNVEVVECVEGRYVSEKVPFGWVYRWRPACVAAQCGCGGKRGTARGGRFRCSS
jgi:hypothetical protein